MLHQPGFQMCSRATGHARSQRKSLLYVNTVKRDLMKNGKQTNKQTSPPPPPPPKKKQCKTCILNINKQTKKIITLETAAEQGVVDTKFHMLWPVQKWVNNRAPSICSLCPLVNNQFFHSLFFQLTTCARNKAPTLFSTHAHLFVWCLFFSHFSWTVAWISQIIPQGC